MPPMPPTPPPPPALICPAPPTSFTSWPTESDLGAYNLWMANLGPRFAGTATHQCLVEQIQQALAPLVLGGDLTEEKITRTFTGWQAEQPTLELDSGQAVQTAGYMPYSGLAPTGVSAPLIFERPGFLRRLIPLLNLLSPFEFKPKHSGKIVAVWIPSVKIPKWLLKYLSRNSLSDFSKWAPYRRTITLELQAPCLNKARAAGVVGVIGILDMSQEHAERQYLPFARPVDQPVGQGVPGIYVDRDRKEVLKSHAGGSAKIVLQGNVDAAATTDHLIYTLPGAHANDSEEEIVLVQTHTDGPSAVEENGIMALLALIHHYAGQDPAQRPRTLKFLFASGHFVKEIEGAKDLIWESPPAWLPKTKATVAIEHLGTKEWIDDKQNGYRVRTDSMGVPRQEPALVFVKGGEHPLETLVATHLPPSRRIVIPSRRRLEKVFNRKFFGEGQYVACTGIPTIGYVPNPNYMFSSADPGGPSQRGHVEKLDPARMLSELDAFRGLLDVLVTDPLSGWPPVEPEVGDCVEPESPCD